jgi:hypothetical protein
MRHGERIDVGFVWQPMSWEQSWRTNGRISKEVELDGQPIWRWFEERDLMTPPLESDKLRYDPPLANRFAMNLAVILRPGNGEQELAIVHRRPDHLAYFADRYELGVSESVHGDVGWMTREEMDVENGTPCLERTAFRCLWQELGIAEKGKLKPAIPEFNVTIKFTALLLNKLNLSPTLVGFAIVNGSLDNLEKANRSSGEHQVVHSQFGIRNVKDAIPWERVRSLEATPAGLAWVLHQWTFDRDCAITPECRARLILYLWEKLGKQQAEVQYTASLGSCKPPSWWDAKKKPVETSRQLTE